MHRDDPNEQYFTVRREDDDTEVQTVRSRIEKKPEKEELLSVPAEFLDRVDDRGCDHRNHCIYRYSEADEREALSK